MYEFEKKPRKSYAIENSDLNQLDFPINEMLFLSSQYKVVERFKKNEDFIHMKLRFHVVLGKYQEKVWSLIKVTQVLGISKGELFENMLQNFRYHVVRVNKVPFEFSIVDFPLKSLNDLIQVAYILKDIDASKLQNTSKEDLHLGFGHIKLFIDNYYDSLALTDVDLDASVGKETSWGI